MDVPRDYPVEDELPDPPLPDDDDSCGFEFDPDPTMTHPGSAENTEPELPPHLRPLEEGDDGSDLMPPPDPKPDDE